MNKSLKEQMLLSDGELDTILGEIWVNGFWWGSGSVFVLTNLIWWLK